jgi:hypothetical protein
VLLLVQQGHSSLRRQVNFNYQMSIRFAEVFVLKNLRIMEHQWVSGSPIDTAKLQEASSVFSQARYDYGKFKSSSAAYRKGFNIHYRLTEIR